MINYQRCIAVLFCLFFLAAPFGAAYAQTCTDGDSDGWGNPADASCTFYVAGKDDCDDSDPVVHPYANINVCDGKDTNCDGVTPDIASEADSDSDGWPLCNDCNDINPNINPGILEGPPGDAKCSDGIDNDCDYLVDMSDQTCQDPCIDDDGDGYYSAASLPQCTFPTDDCEDRVKGADGLPGTADDGANINLGVVDDTCDTIDNNCSGTADDEFGVQPITCGVGVCQNAGTATCAAGAVINDCVENPSQTEGPFGDATCFDTLDNDCDGEWDEVSANPDADCQPCVPTGLPDDNCDGIDDDCNGTPDDLYVPQVTNCGVGECARTGLGQCVGGSIVDDCVAGSPGTESGQPIDPECSDGLDNNCNGAIDECGGCVDSDSDGWGILANPLCPAYAAGRNDCDDNDPLVFPWSTHAGRTCDGKDTNCDGTMPDFPAEKDDDSDGWPLCNDCNDTNPGQ
jgi:hypothetical protein